MLIKESLGRENEQKLILVDYMLQEEEIYVWKFYYFLVAHVWVEFMNLIRFLILLFS